MTKTWKAWDQDVTKGSFIKLLDAYPLFVKSNFQTKLSLTSNGTGTDPKIANELVIQYMVCITHWATLHCGIWYWSELGKYATIHFLQCSTTAELRIIQSIQKNQVQHHANWLCTLLLSTKHHINKWWTNKCIMLEQPYTWSTWMIQQSK